MLYQSYEQVVMRDRPAYWWRPGPALAAASSGQPGLASNVSPATVGPPYSGPALPGAANGISTHCVGTSSVDNAQGWATAAHTVPGSFTAGITMEFWLLPQSLPGNTWHCLMWRNGAGFWSINGNIEMSTGGTANQFIALGTLLRSNWCHVVGIFRSSSNEMWVNGRRFRDIAYGNPETNSTNMITSSITYLGRSAIPDYRFASWRGFLAEPALYPYALSPSQIQDHYRAGITPVRRAGWAPLSMYPFTGEVTPPPPPPPGGLTPITEGLPNKRVLFVSDRPR